MSKLYRTVLTGPKLSSRAAVIRTVQTVSVREARHQPITVSNTGRLCGRAVIYRAVRIVPDIGHTLGLTYGIVRYDHEQRIVVRYPDTTTWELVRYLPAFVARPIVATPISTTAPRPVTKRQPAAQRKLSQDEIREFAEVMAEGGEDVWLPDGSCNLYPEIAPARISTLVAPEDEPDVLDWLTTVRAKSCEH